MSLQSERLAALLDLSHQLGREDRHFALLGEGNTSARVSEKTFLVKASGSNLQTLSRDDVVECAYEKLLGLLDEEEMKDEAVDNLLIASRVGGAEKKPSVESLFHAYLLNLPDVNFVAHTHPVAVNQILCSPHAEKFAESRLFPDEIVCCGIASVFVRYTDPGLVLAREIRTETEAFIKKYQRQPRMILLENHGLITLGPTPNAALAAMLMAQKAAEIYVGAANLGGPDYLTDEQIQRIAGRPDEHYRQRALGL